MRKLDAKEALFVREYMLDLDPKRAALAAGYSKTMAATKAYQWVSNSKVKIHVFSEIERLKAKRNKRLDVDSDYVLKRITEIDQMNVKDILADDGSIKPIKEWPDIWATFISGMDISEKVIQGDEVAMSVFLKKIKWPDKVKNLELMGRHVKVQAFRDQHKHTGEITLTESLKQMAERIDGKTGGLPSNVGKRNNREQQQVGSRRCE
jgi:phage terminase small subunit